MGPRLTVAGNFVNLPFPMATEIPITTIGVLQQRLGPVLYRAVLPNGKEVRAFLSKEMADLRAEFPDGTRVRLEMTPYDFDQARIAGPEPGE